MGDSGAVAKNAWLTRQFMPAIASTAVGVGLSVILPKLQRPESMYGVGLFMLVPFLAGVTGGMTANWKTRATPNAMWAIVGISLVLSLLAGLVLAIEGIMCMAMASPILAGLYLTGYTVAALLLNRLRTRRGPMLVSALPLLMVVTLVAVRQEVPVQLRTERTSVEIAAPPEAIWPLLFNLPSLPPPTHLLFQAGVAHPISIQSLQYAVGSPRECVLSTGVMTERISELEQNRHLKFDVLETPPSMIELNPIAGVKAAHLVGNFTVQSGEFDLIPLPNGHTQLVGTSQYSFRLAPSPYWALWTDTIVEQVHKRVMGEIKRRAERNNQADTRPR